MRGGWKRAAWGLGVIALSLAPATAARAATCETVDACADNLPAAGCAVQNTAAWSCGRVPRLGDVFVIHSGHTIRVEGGGPSIGSAGYIEGTLLFSSAAIDRDAAGYADLNVRCEIGTALHVSPGGTLRMRRGDRLRFDSSHGATCVLSVEDGGHLDIQGSVWPATIAPGGVLASIDPVRCGAGSSGRKYRLTLNSLPPGTNGATLTGRRVVFQSGAAVTRQYEIVEADAAASTVTVCVDLADATSLGERLTPHATLGPRDRPPVRHLQPSPGPSEACLVTPGQPAAYGCCTGPGIGDCVEALPAPGDAVSVVEDAWVEERLGTRGVTLSGPFEGNDPLPTLRAMNFGQRPGSFRSPYSAINFTARTPGQPMPPFEYNNIHDQSGFAPVLFYGVQNAAIRWNAIHDDGPRALSTQSALYIVQTDAALGATCNCGADGTAITDNVLYRTVGNAITAGAFGGQPENHGMTITRNLVYQGCTTNSTECNALELDGCDDCVVEGNVVYDMGVSDGTRRLGTGVNIDAASDRSVVHDNWLVNLGANGIQANPGATMTRNYVSHTYRESASTGRYFGNLFRDAWLGAKDAWGMVAAPRQAMGNVLIGLEDSLTSQLACTTAGLCANYGFYLNSWTMPGAGPVRIEDNVVIGLSAKFEGAAVYVPQPSPPAFDIEVRHLTFDNRGRHLLACKRAVRDAVDQYATPAPYRLEVTDLAAMNLDGCAVFDCSVCDSGLDDSLENAYLRRTLVTSEDVGPADGIDLVDAQYFMVDLGFVDPAHGNYNLSPSSPLFSGGRYPPGDPVGARAFRFDRARLQERWGGALPFPGEQPADIANVPNDDTDADGVIDLHDDCPAIADPGQPDSDGDGAGDACDRCPTTADPEQADSDADGLGDACDPCPYDAGPDPDGDGVCNRFDNCATVANPDQVDTDLDGSGDACDNCPVRFNRRQGDADGDGIGDVCEPGPSVTRTEPHGTNPRQSVQERMRPH